MHIGGKTMNRILGRLRDEAGMTQEAVANMMDVSVNTIQNWERCDRMPTEQMDKLFRLYGIRKERRQKIVDEMIFGRDNEEDGPDNFPSFLFPDHPEYHETAKRIVFDEKEMELFGYCEYLDRGDGDDCCGIGYRYRPGTKPKATEYHVFEKFGGVFSTLAMKAEIYEKVRLMDSLPYSETECSDWNEIRCHKRTTSAGVFLFSEGLSAHGNPVSFCSLPKSSMMTFLGLDGLADIIRKFDGDELFLGTTMSCEQGTSNRDLYVNSKSGYIHGIVRYKGSKQDDYDAHGHYMGSRYEYSYEMSEDLPIVYGLCLKIKAEENEDPEYLAMKNEYERIISLYDKAPSLYPAKPIFHPKYSFHLVLTETGRKFLEWLDK